MSTPFRLTAWKIQQKAGRKLLLFLLGKTQGLPVVGKKREEAEMLVNPLGGGKQVSQKFVAILLQKGGTRDLLEAQWRT